MTTKLPQGVDDIIYFAIGEASMCWSEVPTGIFNTTRANEIAKRLIAELALRDQAIARAAFEQGVEECRKWGDGHPYMIPDDYLQSEEFLRLIKGE